MIHTDPRVFMSSKEQTIAEVKAAFFAAHAHRGQMYGSGPYTDHLFAARQVLSDAEVGGAPCVAILLHDTIEDTETLRVQIADRSGEYVASLVWAVSGMPKGSPRKERVADAYRKIREMPAAIVVKLADRIANIENCVKHDRRGLFRMYQDEQAEFEELLCDTKADVLYPEMVSRLRADFAGGRRTFGIAFETVDSLRAKLQPHHAVTKLRADPGGFVLSFSIESCTDEHRSGVGVVGLLPNVEKAREMCLLRGTPRYRAETEVHGRYGDSGALRFSVRGCEVGVIEDGTFRRIGYGDTWEEALR